MKYTKLKETLQQEFGIRASITTIHQALNLHRKPVKRRQPPIIMLWSASPIAMRVHGGKVQVSLARGLKRVPLAAQIALEAALETDPRGPQT
jgi:hypothetical protein